LPARVRAGPYGYACQVDEKQRRHPVPAVGLALLVSALVGLLVAALALPLVGGAGLAAKRSADEFLVLPAELELRPLAQRTTVLAADGSLLASLYSENRVEVPLSEVPEVTRAAVLAIEDARFYEHNGVDVKGTLRAAVANVQADAVTQGGSTLTQQYVKNALLQAATSEQEQQAAREASIDRKLREARYALALERQLGKDEILERYLNIAYYGNGVYGIGTAAQYYFGVPVSELTAAQSALLAGVVQSPGRLDPVGAPEASLERRDVVLDRMAELGVLGPAEHEAARATPLELRLSPQGSGCEAAEVTAPFFCAHVRQVLEDTEVGAALGATREERQQRLLAGGLTIRTSLDPAVQAGAQAALDERVPRDDPSGVAAAFTAVEPGTGLVRAMAVNRSFGEQDVPGATKVNLAAGGSSGMQAGSTFKPFVLAAALQAGLPLSTTFDAPATYTSPVFTTCTDGECGQPYTVSNAGDSSAGRHDMVSGTHASVNTYYVQLAERTGLEAPPALAESMGLRQFQDGAPTAPLLRGGSFVLGTNEVSPLAMSAAYATFAARGLHCPPRAVTEVLDAGGTPLPLPEQPCAQVLDPAVADTVSSVLRGVVDGPLPSRTGAAASIGRPAAGKTGSTNGSKAAWFVGYVPKLATAVWVGTPQPTELRNITIGGRYFAQVYGGTLPAPLWSDATGAAVAALPVVDLPPLALAAPVAPAPRPGSTSSAPRSTTRAPAPASRAPAPASRAPAPAAPAPAPAPEPAPPKEKDKDKDEDD
jgi:membrane peptidoglycan carboxypeptidase